MATLSSSSSSSRQKMHPQNLLTHPQIPQKLTLGCPILDHCLGGGIPCNSLTEIAAESGCGKTQISLQLLLSAQLPPSLGGLSASSLFIFSEFPFPFRRLHQLSLSHLSNHLHFFGPAYDPRDHIFLHPLHTADELLDEMPRIESFVKNSLSSKFPVRVIVIDSIAALFRTEFENTPIELRRRSSLFFNISGKLKSLAKRFNLAVLVTNQVVDLVSPNEGVNGLRIGNLGSLYSSGRQVCVALGLAWANCVNSRLFLSRDEEVVRGESEELVSESRTKRWLRVVFAPHLPASSCEFVITRQGISGVQTRH